MSVPKSRSAATFMLVGTLALLFGTSTALGAQDRPQAPGNGNELGAVEFGVSCASEVVEDFDRAVALLHHMMYEQARSTFEAIAEADPECAMAHWGVAATLFQPLWPARPGVQERRRGWEHVEKARELGPGSAREEALVDAVAAFFQDPDADEWWPRIERWRDAMEDAYRQHPEDLDVAAFHGLSILAAGQVAEDQVAANARAAEVLEEVHEEEPRHPGAIHYLIHADDAGGRADEHPGVVARYSEIAPRVPHALHMPSHIYVRLGAWPEVIEWNRRSADAALADGSEERVSLHHVHALDYLLYAHLQRAEDRRAAEVLDEALSTGPYQEDFVSAFHLAIMPARYAIERRDWEEAAAIQPREPDYLEWDRYQWPLALSWFARGMGAVMSGEPGRAEEAEARMLALGAQAEAAGESAFATYIEVDRLILAGRIAWAEGNPESAIERVREAAALEETVEKNPVTPGALLPPYEALGDLLMDLDRPADALEAYETSLDVWPGRYRSLLGAARAAAAAEDVERAREHYGTLVDMVNEESDRPGVREAQDFTNQVPGS